MKKSHFLLTSFLFLIVCGTVFCSGCNKKPDPEQPQVVFEPIASFTTDVQYITNPDQTVTAKIIFKNYSAYSNRWRWQFENQGVLETSDIHCCVEKNYPATATARTYEFKLTAYSDVNVGLDGNGEIIYKTYENTQTQYVTVKKP